MQAPNARLEKILWLLFRLHKNCQRNYHKISISVEYLRDTLPRDAYVATKYSFPIE